MIINKKNGHTKNKESTSSFDENKKEFKDLFSELLNGKKENAAYHTGKVSNLNNINLFQSLNSFNNYDFINDLDFQLANEVIKILMNMSISYNIRDNTNIPSPLDSKIFRPENLASNDYKIPVFYDKSFKAISESDSKKSFAEIGFSFCRFKGNLVPCLSLKWPFDNKKKLNYYISLDNSIKLILKVERYQYIKIDFFNTTEDFGNHVRKNITSIYYSYVKSRLKGELTLKKVEFSKIPINEILEYVNLANIYSL